MGAFFAALDPPIDYRVTIVEQDAGLPFNRGAVKNAGFLEGEGESDYVCLHDIDYLPVDADYSFADEPTCALWYGAEQRPVAPGVSDRTVTTDLDSTLGGVLLVPNAVFRQVDGYSNAYWGWGFEDFDLSLRIRARKIPTGRRKGRFQPLDHENHGFKPDATPSAAALANRRIFQAAWAGGTIPTGDGLSSLSYDVLARGSLSGEGVAPERWRYVKIRLNHQPTPDQIAADAARG